MEFAFDCSNRVARYLLRKHEESLLEKVLLSIFIFIRNLNKMIVPVDLQVIVINMHMIINEIGIYSRFREN